MRSFVALALLLLAGLAGCAQVQDPQPTTPAPEPVPYEVPPVPKVDAAALLADHSAFVKANPERRANLPTHESARGGLLERFASYGLETYRQNFTNGIDQANIVGIKWGEVRDQWVVVGGHYDTTHWDCALASLGPCAGHATSEGAYDDGSGTMMAVHLGKAFASVSTYYTVAFVGYDGEERGIEGASAFVEEILSGESPYGSVYIVAALDLDMFGINWPGTNAPVNMITNDAALGDAIQAWRKGYGWPDSQFIQKDGLALGSSDYAAFMGEDIPTVFFISNFEELGTPSPAPDAAYSPFGAYPFWHFQDTVESMTAMAGGPDNLLKGFQSASDLTAFVVHHMATTVPAPVEA